VKGIASSLVTGIIILAVIFLFVRPGSKGVGLVKAVAGGVKGLLSTATGGGNWSSG
jgi:hypothetical protein